MGKFYQEYKASGTKNEYMMDKDDIQEDNIPYKTIFFCQNVRAIQLWIQIN